jgi:hypothetical protein
MTTSATVGPDDAALGTTPAAAAPTGSDSADRERLSPRRKAVVATVLVALIAAVVVVGILFPGMLGPAILIALVAAIVVLELQRPPREVQQHPESFWIT